MSLSIELVKSELLRDNMITGEMSEVEFGLLKRHAEKLNWHSADKAVLMDTAIQVLRASQGPMSLEIQVRSLCHNRNVTADYLQASERINMRQCVLVLGELGGIPAPWAELIQPAVHLFSREFNVLFVEVPAFASNPWQWVKHGPGILRGVLEFLCVRHASVVACGVGGTVFLQTLAQSPDLFGKTHFVYNLDLPPGSQTVPISVAELADVFRQREVQLWFSYSDEPPHYDRMNPGTPQRAYDVVAKLQARLQGERRIGKQDLHYDELVITQAMNRPFDERVKRVTIGRNVLLVFAEVLLASLVSFLSIAPEALQGDIDAAGGLVPDLSQSGGPAAEGLPPELPSLRRLRAGPSAADRQAQAAANRRRLERVNTGLLALMPPPDASGAGPKGKPRRRREPLVPRTLLDADATELDCYREQWALLQGQLEQSPDEAALRAA